MPATYPFERPLGAFPRGDGRTDFRVWAPRPEAVRLRVGDAEHELSDAGYGILEATVEAAPGADYAYVIEGIEFPDPASRWQAHGLRGRSRVLDAGAFEWTDDGFEPPSLREHGALRAARRHVHARGHVRGGDPASARAARARRHDDRADARRRVPRPPRLGLRRRLPQRRPRPLRRAARAAAAGRRRPRRGPRGRARRRLQPRRRVRASRASRRSGRTSRPSTRRRGAGR